MGRKVEIRVSDRGLFSKNENFNFPGLQMMANAHFASCPRNASNSVREGHTNFKHSPTYFVFDRIESPPSFELL